MTNRHLRTTILKLQDRLSDHDRQSLHFLLAKQVPRRIQDDQSLSGTLNLMESLFDQDKISEENFSLLIDAFRDINCKEGLKILTEHRKQVYLNSINQRNSSSESELINGLLDDQEVDKGQTNTLSPPINDDGKNNKSMIINVGTKQTMPCEEEEQQPFYILFKTNEWVFFMIVLLLLVFGIVMTILLVNINKTSCTTKEKISFKEEIQSLKNLLVEKDKEISQLDHRVTELQEDKNNLPVKPGQKFGGANGTYFDDSHLPGFTSTHYLNGLLARHDHDGLETYRFSYYSPYATNSKIPSTHGTDDLPQSHQSKLSSITGKINRVEGVIVNKTINSENGTNITISIITGIRFISQEGHTSPLSDEISGISFNESFVGYTLGYVTGRADHYITQIQFFWYRTDFKFDN